MRKIIHLLVIAVLATVFIGSICNSCTEIGNCSLDGRALMYCNIYTIDPSTKEVIKDTIDTLTITALETDSIILNQDTKVTSLSLPLRYTKDTTIFVLRYNYSTKNNEMDTLYIVHKNASYFISMDCGYSMEQSITSAKKGKSTKKTQKFQLDSVAIKNTDANTDGTQNLQLFYKYRG